MLACSASSVTSRVSPSRAFSVSGNPAQWPLPRVSPRVQDEQERTIWMDGRPHPSKYGAHMKSGFTTGVWEDDVLVTAEGREVLTTAPLDLLIV